MEIKYLQIDSCSQEDINDMFKAICNNIIQKSVIEVKRRVFKLGGSDKEVARAPMTAADLIHVISLYDIPMTLKVSYVSNTVGADIKFKIDRPLPVSDIHSKMEEQRADITNSDLVGVSNIIEEPPRKLPNPLDIPDFKV